jgi:hypothetical protein
MNERKTIVCCLPGLNFSSFWVSNWTVLLSHLQGKFNVHVQFGYSNNIYMTRNQILQAVFESKIDFDYCLWMDDDNILAVEQFNILLDQLEKHGELDGMLGWYWLQPQINGIAPTVSVGIFDPENPEIIKHMTPAEVHNGESFKEIEWGGFGAVLIKWEAMKAVGLKSFAPIIMPDTFWGFSGDDISFFIRAKEKGLKFGVDKRVKVPHLKIRNIDFDPRVFINKEVAQEKQQIAAD